MKQLEDIIKEFDKKMYNLATESSKVRFARDFLIQTYTEGEKHGALLAEQALPLRDKMIRYDTLHLPKIIKRKSMIRPTLLEFAFTILIALILASIICYLITLIL